MDWLNQETAFLVSLSLPLPRLSGCSLTSKRGHFRGARQQEHVNAIYRHWQMPMYDLDFQPIEVSLAEFEAERNAAFWSGFSDGA